MGASKGFGAEGGTVEMETALQRKPFVIEACRAARQRRSDGAKRRKHARLEDWPA